jgi:hypothetical protein
MIGYAYVTGHTVRLMFAVTHIHTEPIRVLSWGLAVFVAASGG